MSSARPVVVVVGGRREPIAKVERAELGRLRVVRRNPSAGALDQINLRPHWMPLRTSNTWNGAVREALRGRAGVYAVREAHNPSTVLYVGESHTPDGAPLRWWKTLLRHFQPGTGAFGRRGEWVHARGGDLEVALWTTRADEARTLEGHMIAELEPLHASGFRPAAEDVDGVPF